MRYEEYLEREERLSRQRAYYAKNRQKVCAYYREWSRKKRKNKKWYAKQLDAQRRCYHKMQAASLKHATRHGDIWTGVDSSQSVRSNPPLLEICRRAGRSYSALKAVRQNGGAVARRRKAAESRRRCLARRAVSKE